jgi:hypothetical protein
VGSDSGGEAEALVAEGFGIDGLHQVAEQTGRRGSWAGQNHGAQFSLPWPIVGQDGGESGIQQGFGYKPSRWDAPKFA